MNRNEDENFESDLEAEERRISGERYHLEMEKDAFAYEKQAFAQELASARAQADEERRFGQFAINFLTWLGWSVLLFLPAVLMVWAAKWLGLLGDNEDPVILGFIVAGLLGLVSWWVVKRKEDRKTK